MDKIISNYLHLIIVNSYTDIINQQIQILQLTYCQKQSFNYHQIKNTDDLKAFPTLRTEVDRAQRSNPCSAGLLSAQNRAQRDKQLSRDGAVSSARKLTSKISKPAMSSTPMKCCLFCLVSSVRFTFFTSHLNMRSYMALARAPTE